MMLLRIVWPRVTATAVSSQEVSMARMIGAVMIEEFSPRFCAFAHRFRQNGSAVVGVIFWAKMARLAATTRLPRQYEVWLNHQYASALIQFLNQFSRDLGEKVCLLCHAGCNH